MFERAEDEKGIFKPMTKEEARQNYLDMIANSDSEETKEFFRSLFRKAYGEEL